MGHGTRDEEGTAQFFELSTALAVQAAPQPVEAALLEFQQPTIAEGWQRLVRRGSQHITVCPLLLFTAGHARQDIPAAVAAAAASTPTVTYGFSRPLSRNSHLMDLVVERLSEAVHRKKRLDANSTAVVMVGRGSHDPCARADMLLLSEAVSVRLQAARHETAFYAMAEPRLGPILERVASVPRVRQVIVYPHLLFEGQLHRAIQDQTRNAADRHRRIHFRSARYLGPDPRIAAALWQRAEPFVGLGR